MINSCHPVQNQVHRNRNEILQKAMSFFQDQVIRY
jgi:hypothetical protein